MRQLTPPSKLRLRNSFSAQLIQEVEQVRGLVDRVPLVILMREQLRYAVRRNTFPLILMLILGTAAALALSIGVKTPWAKWILCVLAGIATIMGAVMAIFTACDIVPRALGLYLTRFLIATQHDRAIAGLRLALVNGNPLLLYLREFEYEETSPDFLALEHQLIEIADGVLILVSLVNPAIDLSLRLSSIPKMLYPIQNWKRLVELMCLRADRILLAANTISEGVRLEVDALVRMNLSSKALFVRMGEVHTQTTAIDGAFAWQIGLPKQSLLYCHEVLAWLGPLLLVDTTNRLASGVALRTARASRALVFAPASLYLLGIRSLLPCSDYKLYRTWLRVRSEADPLRNLRDHLLAEEERAYAQGAAPPFRDLLIESAGTSGPLHDWNRNKILNRQLETAAMLLCRGDTWRRIRKILRG
jgi:hypothetical protein